MIKLTFNRKELMDKRIVGWAIVIILAIVGAITGATININVEQGKVNAHIEYAEEELPAVIEDDRGEVVEEETVPTVEELDGGMFEDATTGVSITEGEYADLGWSETYNVSSPVAFKNDTLGKCIIANNRFGAQCVSLARVFWWSYANRDVSTCGTGMAKGMMNCWQENAGNDFETHWGSAGIQAGDWIIWNTGAYGHVAMALGPVSGSYVTILGENQGGAPCAGGGAATNIINLNTRGIVGYYRPKAYIKPAPKPTPKPEPKPQPAPAPVQDNCGTRVVKQGETMGDIYRECVGEIDDWTKVDNYAKHWYSKGFAIYPTVYDGWVSVGGYGLFAGDTIEYHAEK